MSERKVLQKYYPPDFDARAIEKRRGPKSTGPKIQAVRLMAPFAMRCTTCGEFIYKGRKFNAKKETPPDVKYLNIQIFFFYIRCTRCSAEIVFKTSPQINDYSMVRGAVRNMEPWRNRAAEDETLDDKLNRLEIEEGEAAGEDEKNAMEELEAKNADARREMAAADALDEIRHRNARIHRSEKDGTDYADEVIRTEDEERAQQDREDAEAARQAFAKGQQTLADLHVVGALDDAPGAASSSADMPPPPLPTTTTFKRVVKKKKDHAALLGIKKKAL